MKSEGSGNFPGLKFEVNLVLVVQAKAPLFVNLTARTIFNNKCYIQLQVWKNHVVHLVSAAESWHLKNQARRNLQKRNKIKIQVLIDTFTARQVIGIKTTIKRKEFS